jgi:hypothetical protein
MSDGIRRLELLRNVYRARETSNSESTRALNEIKNEIKIANDERVRDETPITTATNSPYLTDQPFYIKEALFNSSAETEWKEVKSYDEVRNPLAFKNLKKLNIL